MRQIRFRAKRVDNGKWLHGYSLLSLSPDDKEAQYFIPSKGKSCLTQWCAPGRIYCESCTKAVKARADKRDPGREQRRAYNRERYEKLIAAGLCVGCGKKPPLEGRKRCKSCTAKKNESEAVRRIKKRIAREQSKAGQGGEPDA